jgi:Na+-driven multidrug efflux pump
MKCPFFLFLFLFSGLITDASACTVCFGAKDDPVTGAIAQSILFLLGMIGLVLLGIVAFFARIMIRSARMPLPDEEVLAIVQPKSTALPS